MHIVNFFHELARQEKGVFAFYYGRNALKGAGSEYHPLIWLDDPILVSGAQAANTAAYSVNLDILDIPKPGYSIKAAQGKCSTLAFALIEQIKKITPRRYSLQRWDMVTLSEYTDNAAAGIRLSLSLTEAIPLNLCAEYFDPSKEFPINENLPDFAADNPEGCAIFNDKPGLPKFTIES